LDQRVERAFVKYSEKPTTRRLGRLAELVLPEVWALARQLTASEDDARDLCQDLFLSLLLRPPAPGSVASVRGYFSSRVATLARNQRRAAHRRRRHEEASYRRVAEAESLPTDDVDALRDAVESLPEKLRVAVELRYLASQTTREIAAALEVSERSVVGYLARARGLLRGRLGRAFTAALLLAPAARLDAAFAPAAAPAALAPPADLLPRIIEIAANGRALALANARTAAIAGSARTAAIASKHVSTYCALAVLTLAGSAFFAFGGPRSQPPLSDGSVHVTSSEAIPRAFSPPRSPRARSLGAVFDPAIADDSSPRLEVATVDSDTVDRDAGVFGRVVDTSGRPLAGATVSALEYPWSTLSMLVDDEAREAVRGASVHTATDGSFHIPLRRADVVHLRVSRDDPACIEDPERSADLACIELPQRNAGEFVEVVLATAHALDVTALDERGERVPGVDVRFFRREHRKGGAAYDRRHARTGADGTCTFDGLEPGRATIEASHARLGCPGWLDVEIVAGERSHVEVVLPDGRTIHGRVVDRASGEPIAGARIVAPVPDRCVLSDGDGYYAYPGWTGIGVESLSVSARGFGRLTKRVPASGALDFALDPALRVGGRIVDCEGRAIAGATVATVASSWDRHGQQIDHGATTSDSGGRFELASLRADLAQTLVVIAPGGGRYLLDFDATLGDELVVDLETIAIPPAHAIEGRVVDDDLAPVRDATVELHGHNADRERLRAEKRASSVPYAARESRRTDDLGRFRFDGLSPGRYELRVRLADAPDLAQTVELRDGEDIVDLDFTARFGATVTLVAIDASGEPIPGVRFTVSPRSSGEVAKAETDEHGRAFVHGLPHELVEIHARAPLGVLAPLGPRAVFPAGQELIYVAERAALIEGRVVASGGEPLPGLLVWARSRATGAIIASEYADGEGAFTIALHPSTVVDLSLTGSHLRPDLFRGPVTGFRGELVGVVAPSRDVQLVAHRIANDRSLAIHVRDAGGNPLAGVRVVGVRDDGRPVLPLRELPPISDAGGRIEWTRLWSDPIALRVVDLPPELAARGLVAEPVRVAPEGQEVELRLVEAGER